MIILRLFNSFFILHIHQKSFSGLISTGPFDVAFNVVDKVHSQVTGKSAFEGNIVIERSAVVLLSMLLFVQTVVKTVNLEISDAVSRLADHIKEL